MKQNNCFIYVSKLCNSKRKRVEDSSISQKNDDLYIIIVIDDFDNVEVLTVYSFNKRRRERDIGRK